MLKKAMATIVLPTILFGISGCAVTGNGNIDNEGDSRRVNNVMWNNQVDTDIKEVLEKEVANDKTRLVFIRKNDNYSKQTSANIAVNNRFHVSLHAGNYTVVNSCVGTNQLSAQATGFKNNNLLADKQDYNLKGGQTYFFNVVMNEKGQSTLEQITRASALPLLANKRYQSHQVSRVVPNCVAPTAVITPIPEVLPVVPVLAEK